MLSDEQLLAILHSLDGGDAAHDTAHIQRVVANAKRLALAEKAQLAVVVPAAYLHDCVTVPKNSPQRAMASRLAAEHAVVLLRNAGVTDVPLLEGIQHAVEAHSFTAGIPPRTAEAQVVQDADRLDAIGAVGIARCLMLGGAMGSKFYSDADPFCEQREPDDRVSAIDHFYTKLLKLESTMQTAAGREEARRRTEFLRLYLAELRREIQN